MQKKAARRGQRALAFLLCLLMVVTLLPVMGANAAVGDVSATGVELDKTLTLESNGTYTIKLEAFATGTVKTEEKTAGVPCDIVLVLDQSGSMDDDFNGNDTNVSAKKRITALKTAATTFVTQVQKNADQYNVDHKVAIVGFASGTKLESSSEWRNTELLSTEEPVSYSKITTANYQDALVSANSNGTVNNRLTMAIDRVDANGATYGNYGLTMAKGILDNRTDRTYMKPDGDTANRKTIVVFFTDGYPGRYARNDYFYNGKWDNDWNESSYNNITVANSTIDAAAKLKHAGATVYSVGIFSGAAPTDDYNFSIQSRNNNNCTYYDTGTKAANAYMHFVSSDYDSSCTSMTSSARSLIVNNGYYLAASNADDLNKVFETISASIDSSSTSCTLDADSVLKDIISDNLDLPEGFNATENVSVKTADYNGDEKAAESITFTDFDDEHAAPLSSAKVAVRGKTVDVSGFDYKSNYVTGVANKDGTFSGKKLIVTITGLIPNKAGMKMPSNDQGERKSGIYDDDVLKAPVDSPVFDVASRNVVIDFGMTANIARNVINKNTREGVQVQDGGTFTYGDDKTLTFKPTVATADGNYTLPFTGVSSALYYGVNYAADGSPSNAWTWVNVIPANNVYYDDTYLNTQDGTGSSDFTDGNYGYDENVPSNTDTTAVPAGTPKTFTFTGTGIDVYCTTEKTSGWVTARLSKMVDGVDTYVDGAIMKNQYVSEPCLYNVPTLSFTGLDYGTYTLTINTDQYSNYKLDGVRVYNPGNTDVQSQYDESEVNAVFTKVRDILLNDQKSFTVDNEVVGAVYVDEQHEGATLEKYEKEGPKNEVYLGTGDAIAFNVKGYQPGQKVMVGLSAPEAGIGSVKLTKAENAEVLQIASVIDEYYVVTPDANGNVVIKNAGNSLISVTNVKVSGTGASSASIEVSPQLMSYVESFDTLSVIEPETPVTPDPTPETPNNTISAIIHAIWSSVKDSIGKLFGRV